MLKQLSKTLPLSQSAAFANVRRTRKSSNRALTINDSTLYLDFADGRCYSGSGTTATDLSGSGNNATLVNTPTLSAVNGGVMSFNGTNNYLTVPGTQMSGNQLSVSFWMKLNATATNMRPLSKDTGGGATRDWLFQVTSGGASLRWICWNATGTQYTLSVTYTLNTNNWYYVVATYDNANDNLSRLYINGVQLGSVAISGAIRSNTNVDVNIGRYSLGTEYLNGNLGQVIINRSTTAVLSASEILNNYNATRYRYGV